MKSLLWIIVLLLPLSGAGTESSTLTRIDELYADVARKLKGVPVMEAKEAVSRFKRKDVVFIDARSSREQKVSMIPGAVRWKDFEKAEDATYRGRTLIVYCTIGRRSGMITQQLVSDGHAAFNLPGGILSWCHAGGALADDRGASTFRVHTYSRKFALLPDGYDAVH